MTLLILTVLLQSPVAPSAPANSDLNISPDDRSNVSDQSLEQLAVRESRLPARLDHLIYNDPNMRAEIKRVGLEKGCRAIAVSQRQISLEFSPAMVAATVAAIRSVVAEPRLSEMRFRSFIAGPMSAYARRIDVELDRTASSTLTMAFGAMRTAFLKRTRQFPTTGNAKDNFVTPRADLARALNLSGSYDLDNPAHIGMACAELLIPAVKRPTITTHPTPGALTVVPAGK